MQSIKGLFVKYSFLFLTITSYPVCANNLLLNIKDSKQKPLADVVSYLEPINKKNLIRSKAPKKGFIRQRNKTYIPHVSIFQKNTAVSFVNQDRFKHHVYSFSPVKKFEIKLFSGKPPKSIIFDEVGAVIMGCNIHDHMLAYAYIVDTPFYALSQRNGRALLRGIPNGKYRLRLWHPHLKSGRLVEKIVSFPMKKNNMTIQLSLKPHWKTFKKKRSKSTTEEEDYLF